MSAKKSVKRGFVFHNEKGELVLLTIDAELTVKELIITDEEEKYAELPPNKMDVVEVNDLGEDLGMVGMIPLYSLTFDTAETKTAVAVIRMTPSHKLRQVLEQAPPEA